LPNPFSQPKRLHCGVYRRPAEIRRFWKLHHRKTDLFVKEGLRLAQFAAYALCGRLQLGKLICKKGLWPVLLRAALIQNH